MKPCQGGFQKFLKGKHDNEFEALSVNISVYRGRIVPPMQPLCEFRRLDSVLDLSAFRMKYKCCVPGGRLCKDF